MKFKHFAKVLFLLTVVFSWLIPANNAEAVPAFARQMGVPCNGCHFQYFPKLNSFGREFKIGGFTQGAQELIEDDGISLPPVLNAAFFAELEYHKRELKTSSATKAGAERGETKIPSEAALFFGGRLGENLGTLTEFTATGAENFKMIYSKDFGGVQGGLSVFTTETMGPAYGMEGWNTGAQMHIQPGVNMMQSSAQSIITMAAGESSGVTFFASADMFFVAFGLWAPIHLGFEDAGTDLSTYYRIAVTPKLGEWDAMVGIVGTSGSTKVVESDPFADGTGNVDEIKTTVTAINGQFQGDISGMSLGVYFDYVLETDDEATNIYNMEMGGGMMRMNKNSGWGIQADLGVTSTTGVRAALMQKQWEQLTIMGGAKADKKLSATTLGFWHQIRQNVVLAVDYTTYGDDKLVMGTEINSDLMAVIKIGI